MKRNKIRKNKKDKAKRVFCSFVAKLAKDNWKHIYRNKKEADFDIKEIKKNIHKAFVEIINIHELIDNSFVFYPNDYVCFVKDDNVLIRLDISEIREVGKKKVLNITKASFVKLNFEEVSYKEAKANNSIEFKFVQWISQNKNNN